MSRFQSSAVYGLALVAFAAIHSTAMASVAWKGVAVDPSTPLAFENPANWVASTYDPPAATPEVTPPGSDSVWFIDDYNGSIVLSDPRTEATTKLGPGRVGGGDANQVVKLYIDADVTITGQERDEFGAVNPDLREMRVGGEDTTPGDANFPLAMVIQRAGHVNLEYATDPLDSDLKITGDKTNTGGGVWEVGGTSSLTVNDNLLIGEKDNVKATGGIFRVRGSDVGAVTVGDRMLVLSRSATWDQTEVDYGGGNIQKQQNRGKSIVEFVMDENGVTPIDITGAGGLAIGSEFTDINTFTAYVVPGFLRVKLSEPTTAGSGAVGTPEEQVLFTADNIGSRITAFPESQSQEGVFFDPDRSQTGFPHRVIDRLGTGTVISDYAGVTYTWDAVYDDNSQGLGVIENAVTLTNLVISDPGGSGIQGDFDDANGLDPNDANALQAAFGTPIGFADAQNMFDLNADGAIDASDLIELVTNPGFANTSLADFDLDGDTDGDDLAILQSGYGMVGSALFTNGDTDLDGDVDGADFLSWQRLFTGSASNIAAVPEPSSLLLLSAAAFSLIGMRRKSIQA